MGKPNLLYIFTDQQRVDTMRCYGNGQIQTPHLNGLADESFVFENSYVSQPVCSPSRATMLAGLWPHTSGVPVCNVPLPDNVTTFAEHLPDEYATAYMGKWHLGDEIFPQHGFDTWVGSENSYRHSYSSPELLREFSPYYHFLRERGFEPDSENHGERVFSRHMEASMDEGLTKATYLGDKAAEFIRQQQDRPFALCVSYLEPHPPHTGPFNALYDPSSLPTGPAFMRKPPPDAPLITRLMAAFYMASEDYGFDLRSEEGWRGLMARYWGNVSLVDRSVGKILQTLAESGQAENTIVVFTSDHGEQMGDHGLLGKTVMYEESIKVPMLIRAPMLGLQQKRIGGNFSHIDLVPTLLELMGREVPEQMQGTSRVPALRDEQNLKDDIFVEWNGADGHISPSIGEAEVNRSMVQPLRTIVSAERWKLNLLHNDQSELYDLNSYPYEQVNLFGHPEHRERAKELTARVRDWQERTGDTAVLPVV